MKDIREFKSKAEFFKAGSIIPQRIIKVTPRIKSHRVVFGADCWALPTGFGYVVAVDCAGGGSAIFVKEKTKNLRICGESYNGKTITVSNINCYGSQWVDCLNDAISSLRVGAQK